MVCQRKLLLFLTLFSHQWFDWQRGDDDTRRTELQRSVPLILSKTLIQRGKVYQWYKYCKMGKDIFHVRIVNNQSEDHKKAASVSFVGLKR